MMSILGQHLEYIVMRRNHFKPRHFSSESEVRSIMNDNSNASLLNSMASFNIYLRTKNWSKKQTQDMKPLACVIITTCEHMFSRDIILRLIREAEGVSILFAIVFSNHAVLFEEMADAMTSLSMENEELRIPSFQATTTWNIQQQIDSYHRHKFEEKQSESIKDLSNVSN